MTTDTMTAVGPPDRTGRDWRIWFGLASTIFWLWLGFLYIALVVGWSDFVTQPAEALGGFLEGAFAPLAFLWLVIGFFLQQRELRNNNAAILAQYDQMRRQTENAEVQARAIQANALHQEQETALLVAERVNRQLGAVTGLLWMSSQAAGDQPVSDDQVNEMWKRLGSGDPDTFARQCIALHLQKGRAFMWDFLFGTPVRARHSQTIVETFDRLLRIVRRCDPDGIIADALLGSGHGTLYRIIVEQRQLGPPQD